MASVEEIERKQKAMQPLLEQIAQEKDADRIQQLGRQIAEMARELARMADGLERAYAQATGGPGETRVVLTKDQRQRVAAGVERKLKEESRKAAKQIVNELEAAVGANPAPETRAALDQFKREHLGE